MPAVRLPISILILVKDEEEHLPLLLETLGGFEDIVVLDSMSTDGTIEIAEAAGCRVVRRQFDTWAEHQNWAMENIEFRHRWVFYLDADERMTDAVRGEIHQIAASPQEPPPHRAYYVGRDNRLFGRSLRHAMGGGVVMRFFQPAHIRFARRVNPQPVLEGEPGYLRSRFIHHHFARGFAQWFEKHNRYAGWEAQEWIEAVDATPLRWKPLFARDRNTRLQAIKRASFHLPFRPLLKFLHMYLWRRGFLDGSPGFHCCVLMSIFEYMIGLRVKEMRRRSAGKPV
ncbi:glycosyltransferase family 2 protein [Phycisphaera mikurensis]|uniref:Glycosyltransferase n=1 Tax=Phycisphaera mikurensis (strain NBRC 102666 / KCTC 22515 / FYK2301M01) TaxID=1142394 RepID=I0IAE6_PHYMF|nr:glycosyltransferase family 2 protein [Phycisphaera mikurensis]MBB6441770.1 glycosyltransferase involved in cell wall biosynthesis [Phycisphaera mikurensis]BAM02234.1 glycosyltransferase [Phycisphaera mikurensis NBRC 102666]